jgi:hypothetical protein
VQRIIVGLGDTDYLGGDLFSQLSNHCVDFVARGVPRPRRPARHFPIVFAEGLDPASGPGLLFVTVP